MYGFIEDISNLETLSEAYDTFGYAIFLTNDPSYWGKKEGALYDPFRIYEDRVLKGKLNWADQRNRQEGIEDSIKFENRYDLNWTDYSYRPDIAVDGANEFKTLVVKVPPDST